MASSRSAMRPRRPTARTVAVCRCTSCEYESPPVEAGPDIGCGICPVCGRGRLERTTEVEDGV